MVDFPCMSFQTNSGIAYGYKVSPNSGRPGSLTSRPGGRGIKGTYQTTLEIVCQSLQDGRRHLFTDIVTQATANHSLQLHTNR